MPAIDGYAGRVEYCKLGGGRERILEAVRCLYAMSRAIAP